MQATVNQKACIRCGLCPSLCPEVFTLAPGESAQAIAPEVPPEHVLSAQAASDSCPTGAISLIG